MKLNFENVAHENYNFPTTTLNKSFYDPEQPENHRKEREKGKGARATKKK